MSLTASMQSWCDTFKNSCKDRAAIIDVIIKQTNELVNKYNDNRIRMSAATRKQLKLKYMGNAQKVSDILNEYIKDRSGAAAALSSMRR